MDTASNQSSVSRLIFFLESLLASTHQSKTDIEARLDEAQSLLQGWILPETNTVNATCQCALSQKQQLSSFLEKVEKAVKYSQYIREGRCDIASPWSEEAENNACNGDVKKTNASREGSLPRIGLGANREKLSKGRFMSSSQKKTEGNTSINLRKSNVLLTSEPEKHFPTCPLHGSSDASKKAKNIQTVGLAEALDVLGIPSDLVIILKSVHHYINRLRTINVKNRAESSFLRHLNSMNESRWSKFPSHDLLEKFVALPLRVSHRIIPILEDDCSSTYAQRQNCFPSVGIWNPAIYNIIPSGALCVQYQSVEIWNLLQFRIQQLQLSHAEWQICDILSCDPLLANPDLQRCVAPLFLKAATALSRLTVLNLPVLVKTYHC